MNLKQRNSGNKKSGSLKQLRQKEKRSKQIAAEKAPIHISWRVTTVSVVAFALFILLAVRLWSIQVLNASTYKKNANQTIIRKVPIDPPRGIILTRSGQILAGDVSEEVVTIKPAIGPSGKNWVALDPNGEANVAALLGIKESQIAKDLNNIQNIPYQPVPIAYGISQQDILQINEHPNEYNGIAVQQQYLRTYPQNSLASQVVGYVGQINATEYKSVAKTGLYTENDPTYGQTGLEAEYEKYLYGKPGYQLQEVDPAGNPIANIGITPPQSGDSIVLNMDYGLEKTLTTDLTQHLAALRSGQFLGGYVPAPSGAGVVMNIHNGHVLAMVSVPGYNNNLWVGGISNSAYQNLVNTYGYPLNNYAIQSPNPPGSDFKIATATAALDDGLITPGYEFDDPGYYTVGNLTLHDAPGDHPGWITVVPALALSSDDFFYNIGAMFWQQQSRYGVTPIQNMAAKYGFGVPSGIDLPNVDNGQVDSPALRKILHKLAPNVYPDTYYEGDNMEMAFGQGETLITPLELTDAYATFANGGTRYAPEIAAAIVSSSGKVVKQIKPKVMAHVPYASQADYQAILAGFQGAVNNPIGTAYQDFANFPFNKWEVAGKTGTATVQHGSPSTAWFVAFFGPIGNPEYAAAVEVQAGGYGTNGAAPVVRQIIDYLMANPPPKLKL